MATPLRVTMFPHFAMGHITPFLQLANELAERGHKTTIFLPRKAQLLLQHLIRHPNLITINQVTVPHVDGLPPGAETVADIPLSLEPTFTIALDRMQDQVEAFLRAEKPDLVLFDFAHWIPDIAKPLGIKTVQHSAVSAASLAILLVPARNVPADRPITEEELREPPPGYPSSTVLLRRHEVRSLLFVTMPFGEGINFYQRMMTAMKNCDALCIRTCREIEGNFCDYMASQYQKPVFLSGPILTESMDTSLEKRWANWLDGFDRGSVVYCAFGSQFVLEKDQFQELVLGLEQTRLPFFVAGKPPTGCSAMEEAFPEGFEERTKGRGVVYGGWVQQGLILRHPSVGCFVSHCGSGSMWESLMSETQIVLVPQLGDQIWNAKLLVEDLKVAVEVEREDNGWFSKESLSKAINIAMDKDSDVGDTVKKNHEMWKQVLTKPGFLSGYVDKFVHHLQELVNQK